MKGVNLNDKSFLVSVSALAMWLLAWPRCYRQLSTMTSLHVVGRANQQRILDRPTREYRTMQFWWPVAEDRGQWLI